MAYKFQIGAARLSGSITQTDGAFTGASTIDASGDLTVGSITMTEFSVDSSGNTDIDGTLNVEGVPTFQAGAVFSGGITTANAIAGATTISGSGAISGGSLVIAGSTVSAAGLALIDDADAAAQRTTLGLVIGTDVQAQDAGLQYLADLTITNEATFQEQVGLQIGVDVQAYDAQLADIAGLTPTDGNIIVGDGSNFVAESGATARTSLGLGTSDNVQFAEITGSGISASSDVYSGGSFFGAGIGISDASGIVQVNGGLAQTGGEMHLDSGVAGAGLALSSGVLSVGVDDSSIEVDSDALQVKNGGITNDMLAGSIANAKLANSSITLTQGAGMAALGAVSLGGSISVAVDGVLEDLDTLGAAASDGQFIVATGTGAFAYESGATVRTSLGLGTGDSPQFTNLTLSGDLTVNGTQTIINSTAVEIADKNILLASGSANGAAAAGAGLTIEGPEVQWKYEENGESNAAADASSSGDIWIASGSAGLVDIQAAKFYGTFVGDGAELTGVVASSMVELLSTKTANYTLDPTSETIVLADASSSGVALTLPAASGLSGVVIKVKRIDNVLANTVSIAPDSGESLEFVVDNVVSLDTQGAALSLVCNGTAWFIM